MVKSLWRRRPSASMVVASLALFVALGGASYAATQIGSSQIQNGAVTNNKLANGSVGNWKLAFGAVGARKLANGAVGKSQINTAQVQERVAGTCSSGAISAIDNTGQVTCGQTPPNEYGTSTATVKLGSGVTQTASLSLAPSSSYLVSATAQVTATASTGSGQEEVDCTLAGNGASLTRGLQVHVSSTEPEEQTIPLTVAVPSASAAANVTVNCAGKPTPATFAPVVTVDTAINAIQTASNTTETSGG
jgi:hypothetical protein